MKEVQQNFYCLLKSDLGEIILAIETLPEVDQIILSGPTKGPYKFVSDIDLAVYGVAVIYDTVIHPVDLLE